MKKKLGVLKGNKKIEIYANPPLVQQVDSSSFQLTGHRTLKGLSEDILKNGPKVIFLCCGKLHGIH